MADAAFCDMHNEVYDYCPLCEMTEMNKENARLTNEIEQLQAEKKWLHAEINATHKAMSEISSAALSGKGNES